MIDEQNFAEKISIVIDTFDLLKIEKKIITEALKRSKSVTEAAKFLNKSPDIIRRRILFHKIEVETQPSNGKRNTILCVKE